MEPFGFTPLGEPDLPIVILGGGYGGRPYGDGTGAVVTGGPTTITGSKPCYIEGTVFTITDSEPCYIAAPATITDNEPCYVAGLGVITSGHGCYLHSTIPITDNQPAYIDGHVAISSGHFCFMKAPGNVSDFQPAYIRNIGLAYGSKRCFIYQTGILDTSHICYLHGEFVGAFDVTKGCYMDGVVGSNSLFAHQSLYVNGFVPTITSSKGCYIYSPGIILDWRFDEGSGAIVHDHSDNHNDATNVNGPLWVPGPEGVPC